MELTISFRKFYYEYLQCLSVSSMMSVLGKGCQCILLRSFNLPKSDKGSFLMVILTLEASLSYNLQAD